MGDANGKWDSVLERIRAFPRLLILSNLDGTLVEYDENPMVVELPEVARKLLKDLSSSPKASIGIVSSRGILDLISLVGLPDLWYVGNHGYEIQSPSGTYMPFYDPGEAQYLEAIARELRYLTRDIYGLSLDLTGPILALRYRKVDPELVPEVKRRFEELILRHHDRISMASGKMTFEARVRGRCTRGSAVRFIRKSSPADAVPIYFGDESTDIHAFEALKDDGITVSVGSEVSVRAHYTLPGPHSVLEALALINAALRGN